jgi:hypothetical protein
MKFVIRLMTCLISFSACVNKKESSSVSSDSVEFESGFIEVVDEFYSWYLKESYGKSNGLGLMPKVLMGENSVYYLDSVGYLKKLRATNFFSKRYISNQAKAVNDCNKEIGLQKWNGDSELDFEGCEFTTFDQWVGGQGEEINGFNVVSAIQDPGSATNLIVTVETLVDGKKFVRIFVSVVKEGKDFKIDDITIK